MGLFDIFKRNGPVSKAGEIAQATTPLLEFSYDFVQLGLSKNVPYWSLENGFLLKFLGYSAGVLECAQSNTSKLSGSPAYDSLSIDIAFYWFVDAKLSQIRLADIYLKSLKASIDRRLKSPDMSSGLVDGLHVSSDEFARGMMVGTFEYLEFIDCAEKKSSGYLPSGVFTLGLVSGGGDK